MRGPKPILTKPGASLALTAVAAVLLAGCSGRDSESAEKVAAINAASARAEAAAKRAEEAAAKIEKATAPTVIEVDPDATEDAEDAAIAEQNEPVAPDADIKG
ncbi:MAG TPA: hypothetical protein VFV30_08110 [Novosphingobium sp.]|nr:hypothetical protein [Novosphingobium sp.]